MKKELKAVKEFHLAFKQPVSEAPQLIERSRYFLRNNLMFEENEEYLDACYKGDLVEVADALGDMLYVLCGTIIEHGMQDKIQEVFNEIQSSNMSKLNEKGEAILRNDGKILKGKNYFKPNIGAILENDIEKVVGLGEE